MAGALAIEVDNLGKTYGAGARSHVALKGVGLKVERGTAFGLIGPNGAGKTTLVKSLLGVLRPTAGTVRVLGGDPDDPAVRARLGYMPERLHLPPALRAVAYLRSVAALKNLRTTEIELQGLAARVGLGEALGKKLGDYSKGMRQRLGLAAALLGHPELLVLDEPTDGVDPMGRVEIRALLSDELRRGATLFLNSHLLNETERVCSRVGILFDGQLLKEGPLEELTRIDNSWRARYAGPVDAVALAAHGFSAGASPELAHIAAADAAALNRALDAARASGAQLVELSPAERDLEQVLAEAVGARA